MKNNISPRFRSPRRTLMLLTLCVVALIFAAGAGSLLRAAPWGRLEPLKSKRSDVERELGTPLPPSTAGRIDGLSALHFKVAGGMVTVTFVDVKFVTTKKLNSELEGTVLQIVLQHESSTDTPNSLKLSNNSNFQREEKDGVTVFRNLKDGVAYMFFDGKLKTTRYSPSIAQLSAAQGK